MTTTARIDRFLLSLAALVCFTPSVWAEDKKEEILLPNRVSPDGTKEVVVVNFHDPDGNYETGSLSVRNTKDGKVITQRDFFSWGWGPDNMTILWRTDSKCFTIGSSISRGFMGFQAFAPHKGEWVPVEIPQISKEVVKVAKEAGEKRVFVAEDWGGKGCETPSTWLPHNCLRLDVAYRGIEETGEEAYQGFLVTLQIRFFVKKRGFSERILESLGDARQRIFLDGAGFEDPMAGCGRCDGHGGAARHHQG